MSGEQLTYKQAAARARGGHGIRRRTWHELTFVLDDHGDLYLTNKLKPRVEMRDYHPSPEDELATDWEIVY